MIEEAELRIGNMVYDEQNNIVEVSGIDWYGATLQDCPTCDNEFKKFEAFPIPLTPEILENCGFLLRKENWGEQNLNNHFIKLPSGKNLEIFDDGSCNYFEGEAIKSLHQLQNLLFALTGEELEINLEAFDHFITK